MGQDALQVVPAELEATASQWEALTAQLAGAPPSPGQPFQATTAAVNGVNAATSLAAAAFAARTQATVGGMITAAGRYTSHEAASAAAMSNLTQVTVV
ncbi:hypothetical protein [Mycobacterium parmense]|uniref:Uncharacterized protein n=1 Tax=Mycobacterium parmense TaxID=185642 RepID=A0A7I7YUH7_9MYCO|nr:hypothetical protein [Mycobacterium parmense]MCV7351126.1 hypothetical protein [Mycobacterium parmense]ORW60684.1 hypothetical protein AWC20_06875 [Mycobacterium parmense]BBZ45430.1 hypothetical protein MPRM_27110 [Mycobacterium parmense]